MGHFLEAIVLLLPPEAGGRLQPIAPREGSYRARVGSLQIRFIEGPPTIEPGQAGRVVAEVESSVADLSPFARGSELEIIEHDCVVGVLTVTRLWRSAVAV
jgi:hypothetical protein